MSWAQVVRKIPEKKMKQMVALNMDPGKIIFIY